MYCTIARLFMRSSLALILGTIIFGGQSLAQELSDPRAILDGAEEKFAAPQVSWFYETQDALQAEMQTVAAALEAQGSAYADPWKEHLRWSLLEKNLVPLADINLAEIELARRWMYSNRKGMELPFYANLREKTDAYLDAAYTLTQSDLQQQFNAQVVIARQQISDLLDNPTDAKAAALGRTLGWLEQTQQLNAEVAALRAQLSQPNAQILVGKNLVFNFMSTQSPQVKQSLPVADSGEAPPTRRFQIPRMVHVRGTAHTVGEISLELVPNDLQAELSIVYNGEVDSHCHADAGPVTFNIRTIGPMKASKPVTFGPTGIEMGETSIHPRVRTRVTNINADNFLIQRMGERRINDPNNKTHISKRARQKAVQVLENEMDDKVGEAIDEIKAEIARMQGNASEFGDIFAPVVREGARPFFHSTSSAPDAIAANIMSQRREQFGAATPCPLDFTEGDVRFRMHVSFLNNMMETIMAGKMFTDQYFMQYAKVLQPTLPLDLMVHARTPRWAIIAAKPRPLELSIPAPNQFQFALNIASLEVDGEKFNEPTTATVRYELVKNEFDEYYLERTTDVQLNSSLPTAQRDFLQKKLSAFFAPVLDAGGVSIPEGGSLGSLSTLQFLGVQADQDWLVVGVNVPKEFVDNVMKAQDADPAAPVDPDAPVELVLPPPFATDSALSGYPTTP